MRIAIHFATNRDPDDDRPLGFGRRFNPALTSELRFGEVSLDVRRRIGPTTKGSGLADDLSADLAKGRGRCEVFPERLDVEPAVLGSREFFRRLKEQMDEGQDTLVLVHGYNVSFPEAAGTALALQALLRAKGLAIAVVLFSWPSDGSAMPFRAYWSDRDDAAASGVAFSRAFQKLSEFLRANVTAANWCGRSIHLLAHSMGNFVLENTVWHLRKNLPGSLPRVFSEIVLAAADVDHDAFESESKLARLPELGKRISVYYNRSDRALQVSDATKGHPDRLGQSGPKHPLDVPTGVVNVDCSDVASGLVRHSYYLDQALDDLAATLRAEREDRIARREYVASANSYRLTEARPRRKRA